MTSAPLSSGETNTCVPVPPLEESLQAAQCVPLELLRAHTSVCVTRDFFPPSRFPFSHFRKSLLLVPPLCILPLCTWNAYTFVSENYLIREFQRKKVVLRLFFYLNISQPCGPLPVSVTSGAQRRKYFVI